MGDGLKRAVTAAKATRGQTPQEKRSSAGMPEPKAGQVWADCDKRSRDVLGNDREVEIVSLDGGAFANCVVLPERRSTRISGQRMVPGSTGYRYVRG